MTYNNTNDDRVCDLVMMLEQLLRHEIDTHRLRHQNVIQVLTLVLGTFLADIPIRSQRDVIIKKLARILAVDVADVIKEKDT